MAVSKIELNSFSDVIGFPVIEKGVYLLTGEPGSGKSTLAVQFLNSLAGNGLFISCKRPENRFSLLLKDVDHKTILSPIQFESLEYGKKVLPSDIENLAKKVSAANLVLDDLHVLIEQWNQQELRDFIKYLLHSPKAILLTSLLPGDAKQISDSIMRLSDIADGLIEIKHQSKNSQIIRCLSILKHPGVMGTITSKTISNSDRGIVEQVDSWLSPDKPEVYAPSTVTYPTTMTILPEVLYFSPLHHQQIRKRVELYNRLNPSNSIIIPDTPVSTIIEYQQIIQDLREGKSTYSCLPIDLIHLPDLVEKEMIHPLDDYFTDVQQQVYLDKAIQQCRYHGRTFAVPHTINVGVVAYRQDLLEKAHKPVPVYWSDLLDTLRAVLKNKNETELFGYGFQGAQYENLTCNLLEMIWSNGGQVFDSNGQISIDRPESMEALQLLHDLIYKYHYSPKETPFMMDTHGEKLFLEGKMAFLRTWPRIISQSELPSSHVSGRVGIMPIPIGSHGRESIPVVRTTGYIIPKTVPDPQKVWEALAYLTREEAAVEDASIGWACPVLKDLYLHPDVLRARPYYRQILKMIGKGRNRQLIPGYTTYSQLIQRECHRVLRNEQTAVQSMEIIKFEMERILNPEFSMQPIQKATDYILLHLGEEITRDMVAKSVGISPSHFSVLFKDMTGQTFTDYLMHARIEEAKRLLGNPEINISLISKQVGFNDESYFSFTFKKITGVTPSQYRNYIQGIILSI